jgi:hypothetical protein
VRLNENVLVQFCLAHFIPDVKFLVEHPNRKNRAYGKRLIDDLRKLFDVIHRREEYTSEAAFRRALEAARNDLVWDATMESPGTREAAALLGALLYANVRLLPIHHGSGRGTDEQAGGTGDLVCGDPSQNNPRNPKRARPPVVRAHVDGRPNLRSTGSVGLSLPVCGGRSPLQFNRRPPSRRTVRKFVRLAVAMLANFFVSRLTSSFPPLRLDVRAVTVENP